VIVSDAKDIRADERADSAVGDEPFLERWSRRKRALDETEVSGQDAAAVAAVPAVETPPAEPVLTDADMPPIESLDGESDYSPFMSPGVSEHLRTRALRKLFHLPAFNITDGLNDYDEDFTGFAGLRMLKRELEAADRAADDSTTGGSDAAVTGGIEDTDEQPRDENDDSEETV
jgi:hypothetical protein